MHNILCILNNNIEINSSRIINLQMENDSNDKLKANILVTKSLYNKLLGNNINDVNCEILINNEQYFEGNIASIQTDNDLCSINFINKNLISQNNTSQNDNTEPDILEIFKINNPSLFQKRNVIQSNITVSNIENSIIKNSLKISIDKLSPIGELDLLVSASWNKICTGYCDLTNKINNKLNNGLICTLTPNKLIKSWPKLFDRLVTNNKEVLKTKYFITHSKLEEYNNNTVTIGNNKQIEINETCFKCKLSIGWEYSQFITENLRCKIINNKVNTNNKQVLNINLHNVQEYIEDIYGNSFFKSKIGNNIFNIVLTEVKQFIINSMQNITIQFQIPFSRFVDTLQINKFIKINNYTILINKIEMSFIKGKEIVTITGTGSEYNNAFDNVVPSNILLNSIQLNNKGNMTNVSGSSHANMILNDAKSSSNNNKDNMTNVLGSGFHSDMSLNDAQSNSNNNDNNATTDILENDFDYSNNAQPNNNILENIEILNTASEQLERINSINCNDNNYKLLINNILNENPTKLLITLKPIKTEHNKIENLYINDIYL